MMDPVQPNVVTLALEPGLDTAAALRTDGIAFDLAGTACPAATFGAPRGIG